jgi:hypothetical protein
MFQAFIESKLSVPLPPPKKLDPDLKRSYLDGLQNFRRKFRRNSSEEIEVRRQTSAPFNLVYESEESFGSSFSVCSDANNKLEADILVPLTTVYVLAHFCPVAFFRQMIALKITLKKTHF